MKHDEKDLSRGEIIIYQTDDGRIKLDVRLEKETLWMTQNDMAQLFQCSADNISLHLKNIYEEGELDPTATAEEFSVVRQEGARQVRRMLTFYNLDVVISVGYRVKSLIATRFRIWATERLREYIVKGFTMDDDRLKQSGGGGYFDELLARIRDIRSSEKVFWRKILDIYATSIDYDPKTDVSRNFFKVIQNKMHWAAHGQTAAEVIFNRADATEPHMGMTNWVGSSIRKSEAEIAKNYLNAEELDLLNRIVTLYLDFAELQAVQHKAMTMSDWIGKLDDFLKLSGRDVLTHAGKISHDAALQKAHAEYEKFHLMQLDAPTEVEKHFIEAEKELKQIESARKSTSAKEKKRGRK
ncbi:MAG: virulence RhuM family protein [SAR324 cluster bacterium]|nr:virulence RhuM family protein [SAR324 cluster bacterium]